MLARRPNASIPPIIDRIEIVATFESGLVEIEQRWPEVQFDVERFAAYVRDRICTQRDLPAMLPRLRVVDLFIAWRATCSSDGVAAFESELAYDLHRIIARFPHVDAGLLAEVVRVTLFVGAADGPRLVEYTGFGALRDWVEVVVTQICIDAVNVLRPDPRARDEAATATSSRS